MLYTRYIPFTADNMLLLYGKIYRQQRSLSSLRSPVECDKYGKFNVHSLLIDHIINSSVRKLYSKQITINLKYIFLNETFQL